MLEGRRFKFHCNGTLYDFKLERVNGLNGCFLHASGNGLRFVLLRFESPAESFIVVAPEGVKTSQLSCRLRSVNGRWHRHPVVFVMAIVSGADLTVADRPPSHAVVIVTAIVIIIVVSSLRRMALRFG